MRTPTLRITMSSRRGVGKRRSVGVYASGGDWAHAVQYLPSIAAFALGTVVARLLGVQTNKHAFRATLICQGLEGTVLFFLALFGAKLFDQPVVPLIAFCTALQNTSFTALGPWKFNDAITLRNVRNGTPAIVFWLLGRDREKNREHVMSPIRCCPSFSQARYSVASTHGMTNNTPWFLASFWFCQDLS